jgi:hypothetical protein
MENYPEDIIQQTCAKLNVLLKRAENIPLELRVASVNGELVWYIPHVKESSNKEATMTGLATSSTRAMKGTLGSRISLSTSPGTSNCSVGTGERHRSQLSATTAGDCKPEF